MNTDPDGIPVRPPAPGDRVTWNESGRARRGMVIEVISIGGRPRLVVSCPGEQRSTVVAADEPSLARGREPDPGRRQRAGP